MRLVRQLIKIGALLSISALAITLLARAYSAWQGRGKIYAADDVPTRPVAIVFGARVYTNGRPSAMLADRVHAAADLYHAGKVKVLLLSGDNSTDTYNEPEAMRKYALDLGVPDSALVLDYAGLRTYDTCYRARDIFKVDSAVLVTQDFHLDRALLTCQGLGIDSVGVGADYVRPTGYLAINLVNSQVRELPATLVSILDLAFGAKPTFLGTPLPIHTD